MISLNINLDKGAEVFTEDGKTLLLHTSEIGTILESEEEYLLLLAPPEEDMELVSNSLNCDKISLTDGSPGYKEEFLIFSRMKKKKMIKINVDVIDSNYAIGKDNVN